jgi:hypothetical protein
VVIVAGGDAKSSANLSLLHDAIIKAAVIIVVLMNNLFMLKPKIK